MTEAFHSWHFLIHKTIHPSCNVPADGMVQWHIFSPMCYEQLISRRLKVPSIILRYSQQKNERTMLSFGFVYECAWAFHTRLPTLVVILIKCHYCPFSGPSQASVKLSGPHLISMAVLKLLLSVKLISKICISATA